MNAFDLVGTSAPRPFPKWLPHVGGLLAAAFVASFVSHLPLVHTLSPGEILGLAFENVLEVFLASAAVAWGLCTIRPRPSGADTRRLILRTSLDALWLAPLALFIREDSLWAMPMAAVFVTRAVRSFRLLQDEPAPTDREESPLLFHRNALGPPQSSAFWQPCALKQAQSLLLRDTHSLQRFSWELRPRSGRGHSQRARNRTADNHVRHTLALCHSLFSQS